MEAVVTLANLAENPETHAVAFSGAQGEAAFALFVHLLKADKAELQREGFRALSCLALARAGAAGAGANNSSPGNKAHVNSRTQELP